MDRQNTRSTVLCWRPERSAVSDLQSPGIRGSSARSGCGARSRSVPERALTFKLLTSRSSKLYHILICFDELFFSVHPKYEYLYIRFEHTYTPDLNLLVLRLSILHFLCTYTTCLCLLCTLCSVYSIHPLLCSLYYYTCCFGVLCIPCSSGSYTLYLLFYILCTLYREPY